MPDTIFEINVTHSPQLKNGQPVIAVNPTDPRNLVFVSTNHAPKGAPRGMASFQGFLAFSTDGGHSWTNVAYPLGNAEGCGEPNLSVDQTGKFYVLNNQLGGKASSNLTTNHIAIAWSTDGGRTWSDPVITSLNVGGYPKLRIDAKTGNLYAIGGRGGMFANGIAMSDDEGQNWRSPRAFPGWHLAVHDGLLATAVSRGRLVFWISSDAGRSFKRFIVTNGDGHPVRAGYSPGISGNGLVAPLLDGLGIALGSIVRKIRTALMGPFSPDPPPWVSADPTQLGRFAIMIPKKGLFEIYVTDDAGAHWVKPATIPAPNATSAWIDFGPLGYLGVMWRNSAVDVYACISFDHGRSFGAPIKINAATQLIGDTGPLGDDWSWITVDGQHAYVAWSDARSGGSIDGIFAKVPLSMFRPLTTSST